MNIDKKVRYGQVSDLQQNILKDIVSDRHVKVEFQRQQTSSANYQRLPEKRKSVSESISEYIKDQFSKGRQQQ